MDMSVTNVNYPLIDPLNTIHLNNENKKNPPI